ncbi:Signal transduction histidine kinase [Lentzea xinjiangensis]|uniref:histidine kinase n=1 Tax=Lentzea xinjiangensis TaxID=402600 RepID=A0A1H9W555_9PSEU|nr:nitrate- and nitrite sensing domain-containing protein [Lentzea xinjiangensis]SES29028.1 Signal transduction histidine kinase [Lentzea xinjiangensis]
MVFPWRPPTMANWRVRTKLVVVMVPLALAVFWLAGNRIVAQESTYGDLVRAQHALEVCARGWEVTDALQAERSAVMGFIHSGRKDSASLVEAVQRVDAAHAALRAAVRAPEQLNTAVAASADKALTELDGLDGLRRTVQQTRYPDVSALARYGQILDGLVWMGRSTADSVSTLPVGSDVAALQALGAAQEHLSTQNAILVAAAYSRDLPPQQANLLRAAQSRFDAAIGEFTAAAGPQLRQRYQDVVSGAEVDERSRLVQLALVQSGANRPISVDAAAAARTGAATAGRITAVRNEVAAGAGATTNALATSARQTTWEVSAGIVAVLLIAFAVAVLMARTILRPLRVLRHTALRVAKHDLPEAIERILDHRDPFDVVDDEILTVPIHSREETGQLARAFETVLFAAVHLAAQRAHLRDNVNAVLVSLARRSQTLLEHLLAGIDVLERDEQDPDRLARLFELDHLATRMRRNSENLLVLSGAGLGTRLARPVALHEVLYAAVSEIEQYTRVDTEAKAEVAVLGHVAKDLVHLLAELLDNATVMSEPPTKVTLRGDLDRRRRHLVIEVHDTGMGMPEDLIRQYNQFLAAPPDLDVKAAERMGLHVVARLAQRHGIPVSLRAGGTLDGGITARVAVPVTLLADAQPPVLPALHATANPQPQLVAAAGEAELVQPSDHEGHAQPGDEAHTTQLPRPTPPARRSVSGHVTDSPASPVDGHAADSDATTERLEPIAELSEWFTPDQGAVPKPAGPDGMRTTAADAASTRSRGSGAGPAALYELRRGLRAATVTSWSAPGDPGWDAANAILAGATLDEQPGSGLPKRTPKARLVPGSPAAPDSAVTPTADPERTRRHLGSLQRGVQRARDEAGTPTPPIATTEVTDR